MPFPLLTVFGLGRIPVAPGTWGSMPTVLLAAALLALGISPASNPVAYNAILLAWMLVFALACLSQGDAAEARFNGKDPSQVVADEAAGQVIPLLFLPAAALATPLSAAFVLFYAFLAFRVMDILKPPPAGALQRYPSGWGILLDDLVAGLYAAIVLQAVIRLS